MLIQFHSLTPTLSHKKYKNCKINAVIKGKKLDRICLNDFLYSSKTLILDKE